MARRVSGIGQEARHGLAVVAVTACARCVCLGLVWVLCLARQPAQAVDLGADLKVMGQVRRGDQSRQDESPVDLYGNVGVGGLPYGGSVDAYFRVERDFATERESANLYVGALRMPGAVRGVDFTLGRQFLSEVPGVAVVADAGKVRLDSGGPVAVTLFGGQPQYFEPTYSSERLSQDEIVFGGALRTTRWRRGALSLGFLQQEREQRVLRQVLSGGGVRTFPSLPGTPTLYGVVAFDADRHNVDAGTLGVELAALRARLAVSIEGGYYKPQDHGERLTMTLDRREDAIFEMLSVSEMGQVRGGVRYGVNPKVMVLGDYSYQRYERVDGHFVNGHIGSAGFRWLPCGDGLEVVRLEYYVLDSEGGWVNGGRGTYESRVYHRVVYRSGIDVAAYEKASNQKHTLVSGFVGLGYELRDNLFVEVSLEGNRNKRFDEDYRFGFLVEYRLRRQAAVGEPGGGAP